MAEVEVIFEDNIAIITINRPEAKNSVNHAVADGIAKAVIDIEQRDEISISILTGAGGTFCAGMDLKAFLKGESVRIGDRGFGGLAQAKLQKPMIAAVEGYALAGGFELALACDIIIASSTAKFGLPEVKRGLVANAGGLLRLPRQLPARIATEIILTGDSVDAAYLERFGLINRLVEPGEALAEAKKMARTIAGNGPLAIRTARRVINESEDWSSAEMFDRQSAITAPVFTSADAKEGATAFAEKRAPIWRGH